MLAVVICTKMDKKSKDIQFFANELSNADRDIAASKRLLELPMATLNIYNGSNEKVDIQIWQGLKKPLAEFLQNYFESEKQKIYTQISDKLKE